MKAHEPALAMSEEISSRDTKRVSSGVEAETTPERILDVAERLFAQKGFSGTVVRDIAREAGLTAPSRYNHFEGKQALHEAVLAPGAQPPADTTDGADAADAAEQEQVKHDIAGFDKGNDFEPVDLKIIEYADITQGFGAGYQAHLGGAVDGGLVIEAAAGGGAQGGEGTEGGTEGGGWRVALVSVRSSGCG
mgnify:CR=1 FL=1